MSPSVIFFIQALVIVVLPVAVLRFSGLKEVLPRVVVQILVGIALGPSVFDRLAPGLYQLLFNPASLSPLSGIGSVAILIFGLITGLHLGPEILRDNGRVFSVVAVAIVMVPTAMGSMAGLCIAAVHPEELPPGISSTEFAVAVGICAGMVAPPVLGVVLREMNSPGSRLGHFALGIAGINDTALWILLSILLTAKAGQVSGGLFGLAGLLLVPLYLVFMVKVVRPLLGSMVVARMQDGTIVVELA